MPKTYTNAQRKKIADTINKLTYYPCIHDVGEIIAQDTAIKNSNNYTLNNYGFIVLVRKLSDKTFDNLNKYINTTMKTKLSKRPTSDFSNLDTLSEQSSKTTDYKLSSREKKFMKKIQSTS